MFKKIGKFFKYIWANKNSILAILTSVVAICLATFVVLKGWILGSNLGIFNFIKDITPEVEAVQAVNVGDILVPEIAAINVGDILVPEVLAGEADVVVGINIGDVLVPAVYEGEVLVSEAVLATEADVVAAVNIGDILVPAVIAGEGDVVEYVAAVLATEEDVVIGVEYAPAIVNGLNVYGYIILGILACGICVLDIYGIVNKYGFESIEAFAERIGARKAEAEAKLNSKEQIAEYKEKLNVFNKGLKEVVKKIENLEGKIGEIKTLMDNGLATSEQINNYNSIVGEINNLKALEVNYNNKIAEVKSNM